MSISLYYYLVAGVHFGDIDNFIRVVGSDEKFEEIMEDDLIDRFDGVEVINGRDGQFVIVGDVIAESEAFQGDYKEKIDLEGLRVRLDNVKNAVEKELGIELDETCETGIWFFNNYL